MTRCINAEAIRRHLTKGGEQAKAQLSIDAKISISMIDKLIADVYPTVPRLATRERLCAALGVSEDELFPLIK